MGGLGTSGNGLLRVRGLEPSDIRLGRGNRECDLLTRLRMLVREPEVSESSLVGVRGGDGGRVT